jgi:hypothetical protein
LVAYPQDRPPEDAYANFSTLLEHSASLSSEESISMAQLAMLIRSFNEDLDPKEALHVVCRISTNAHSITTNTLDEVAIGVYPRAALVNHCCWPNAVASFDGARVALHAITPIAAGEEVFISYGLT